MVEKVWHSLMCSIRLWITLDEIRVIVKLYHAADSCQCLEAMRTASCIATLILVNSRTKSGQEMVIRKFLRHLLGLREDVPEELTISHDA